MPDPTERPADHLDDFLSEVFGTQGAAEPTSAGLDSTLAETVRRVASLDDAPSPSTAFARRLWEDLMHQAEIAGATPLHPPATRLTNGRTPSRRRWVPVPPFAGGHHRRVQGLVATALLLAVTLAAFYVAFFSGQQQIATPPAGASPTPASSPAPAVTTEISTTASFPAAALPQNGAEVDFFRWTLEPGFTTTREPGNFPAGVRIDLVVSGTYATRVDGPLLILRAGATGTPESIPAGTEVTLGPSDAAIYPENDRGQTWGNPGADPLVLLVGGIFATALPNPPAGLEPVTLGTIASNEWAGAFAVPDGPVALTLRRLIFDPGATLPAYTAAGPELIGIEDGPLAVTRTGKPLPPSAPSGEEVVRSASEAIRVAPGMLVALRNPDMEPIVIVIMTIATAAGDAGSPAPATPAS